MQNYSRATIEGFVTHDPLVRKTKTGKDVCSFSLAINHFVKENSEPQVSYIDVETWEKLAGICSGYITKGKRVIVIGTLRQDRWEGKDGKTQSKLKVVGSEVRFIESLKSVNVSEEMAEAV